MMELLRAWLTGITAAAILCALANSLMPEGAVRRVGKLACGLLMLSAVFRPLVEVEALSPGDLLKDCQAQAAVQTQALEEERNTALKSIIEREFAAYIVDKAAEWGLTVTAEVECAASEDGLYLPCRAEVAGPLSQADRSRLTGMIREDLGIPEEGQTYHTGEELP